MIAIFLPLPNGNPNYLIAIPHPLIETLFIVASLPRDSWTTIRFLGLRTFQSTEFAATPTTTFYPHNNFPLEECIPGLPLSSISQFFQFPCQLRKRGRRRTLMKTVTPWRNPLHWLSLLSTFPKLWGKSDDFLWWRNRKDNIHIFQRGWPPLPSGWILFLKGWM